MKPHEKLQNVNELISIKKKSKLTFASNKKKKHKFKN